MVGEWPAPTERPAYAFPGSLRAAALDGNSVAARPPAAKNAGMPAVLPPRLRPGDLLRVVAPSQSLSIISPSNRATADRRLAELGLRVSFGAHVEESDPFASSSVASRVADLRDAFADPEVAGVLTVIGGFNSGELLPRLDWELIGANPKVLCGYSDITALQCAALARANLVTYSGPHWSSFAMQRHFEPTLRWFRDCLFGGEPLDLEPSAWWSNDEWYLDQDDRHLLPNEGWWVLAEGRASGPIVGGNLSTVALLHGTPFMPPLEGAVLFLEDDHESRPWHVARNLTALLQQPGAEAVAGLVVGRFERATGMTRELLELLVRSQPALRGRPVIANADFGHTDPMLTFPIGGEVELEAGPGDQAAIRITRH
jgi:muramoyltetrapeptide carboxypeptidase